MRFELSIITPDDGVFSAVGLEALAEVFRDVFGFDAGVPAFRAVADAVVEEDNAIHLSVPVGEKAGVFRPPRPSAYFSCVSYIRVRRVYTCVDRFSTLEQPGSAGTHPRNLPGILASHRYPPVDCCDLGARSDLPRLR